jgi:hypothetical protein
MKALVYLVLVWLTASLAQAFTVESGYIQQPSGQYVKATKITCDAKTSIHCSKICSSSSSCQRVEPYCRNCAGTTSPLMRQLFTELSKYFEIKEQLLDLNLLVQYLASEQYVLLDMNSVFNYYTPLGSEAIVQELRAFCGETASSALLAVKLDKVFQPAELNYVLCHDNRGDTVAFKVAPRQPGVGHRPLNTPLVFKLN